jgi:hypothetical protein
MDGDSCPYHERQAALDSFRSFRSLSEEEHAEYVELCKHTLLCKHQREVFCHLRDELELHQVLVVLDFSSHVTTGSRRVTDLVMAIYRRYSMSEAASVRFYDILFDKGHQDVPTVKRAWEVLLSATEVLSVPLAELELWVWSDGGPSHFRLNESFHMYTELKAKYGIKDIIYNFFAPYHGKSVCDAHSGQLKSRIRRVRTTGKPARTLLRTLAFQTLHASRSGQQVPAAADIAAIASQMSRTTATTLPTIPKLPTSSKTKYRFCDSIYNAHNHLSAFLPPLISFGASLQLANGFSYGRWIRDGWHVESNQSLIFKTLLG